MERYFERMIDADETRRLKARNLRYRKAIVKNINLDYIQQELYEISNNCDDVRWYFNFDEDETLINALDGNEDEAVEFKMMFCDLCAECEQMQEDLNGAYIPECFNDFFVAIGVGYSGGGLLGWDEYEQDYFGIEISDSVAEKESKKRLMRLTKEQIIESAHICFKIQAAYLGIQNRYNCLKAAIDILRDENTGYLQIVKQIEEVYEKANKDKFYPWYESTKELEYLARSMPDEAWIQ